MAKKSAKESEGASKRVGGKRMSGRGLRQIYSQKLHPEVEQKIDLLMFLREAIYRAKALKEEGAPRPTRDELWDEALKEFFEVFEKLDNYRFPAPPKVGMRKSFWVDFDFSRRVDNLAMKRRINVARILDAAISDYLSRRIGPSIQKSMKQIAENASEALDIGEHSAAQVIAGLIETQRRLK